MNKLCIQICKSIEFIHSKHIVHGDIKPDNILIETTTNTPYIIDFGLSGSILTNCPIQSSFGTKYFTLYFLSIKEEKFAELDDISTITGIRFG